VGEPSNTPANLLNAADGENKVPGMGIEMPRPRRGGVVFAVPAHRAHRTEGPLAKTMTRGYTE
jgi:hypothetical protein